MNVSPHVFIVSTIVGGPHSAGEDEIRLLKTIIHSHLTSTRGKGIDVVYFSILVDGDIVAYNRPKAHKLRLMQVRRCALVELGVPTSAWKNRSPIEIRQFLCECVEAALKLLIVRLKKRKLCLNCERLLD